MIADKKITADQAKLGYVGAYTYAEVISGYTSFYLGAKSVCPSATMKVTFTGSWYDETAEKEAAQKLINDGCVVISQHADSMGAPTACEKAGVPNVSYNGSTESACPNTFIVSSRINWLLTMSTASRQFKRVRKSKLTGLAHLPTIPYASQTSVQRQQLTAQQKQLKRQRRVLKTAQSMYLILQHSLLQ